MHARLARSALIVLTVLGLLMPRVSAAVSLVAPGTQVVVICTGDGLRTLVIGPDGKPTLAGHQTEHCLLAPSVDAPWRVVVEAPAPLLVGQVGGPSGDLVRGAGDVGARPLPRAPPAA